MASMDKCPGMMNVRLREPVIGSLRSIARSREPKPFSMNHLVFTLKSFELCTRGFQESDTRLRELPFELRYRVCRSESLDAHQVALAECWSDERSPPQRGQLPQKSAVWPAGAPVCLNDSPTQVHG